MVTAMSSKITLAQSTTASSASTSRLPQPPLPGSAVHGEHALDGPLAQNNRPWVLLLDVDGTLLEFADEPAAVIVNAQLHRVLRDLHRALGGALALVSGRRLEDVDRLFDEPGWAAAGLHGLQLRHAGQDISERVIDPAQQAHLHAAVRKLMEAFPAARVEDKGVAVAVHCREVPSLWPALQAACAALLPSVPGYELQPGNLVLEFKPVGSDKGRAVRELLSTPWAAGRTAVYVGDDLTDEHAFAVVNELGGISVRVGYREPTLARFGLADPTAVQAWLEHVLGALTQQAPPA